MRFAHIADAHLGYRQYGLKAREEDFAQAFQATVDGILRRDVQVLVIAGDLYDKRVIRPETRQVAVDALEKVREAGGITLVVHGNHERAMYSKELTWLQSLDADGLVEILDEGHFWDFVWEGRVVQFVGLSYGSSSIQEVAAYMRARPGGPRVLVCHIGVSDSFGGRIPGGLSARDFHSILEGTGVVYVATGHFHKTWHDDLIYQPGPLSPCKINEDEGGFFLVDIEEGTVKAEFVPVKDYHSGRRFVRARISTLQELVGAPGVTDAIVKLTFTQDMPTRSEVESALVFQPLKLLLDYDVAESEVEQESGTTGEGLEREALAGLLPENLVDVAHQLKKLVLGGDSAQGIVDYLEELCA